MDAQQDSTSHNMPSRFEGFPGLMQGGYLASVAADDLAGPVRVEIRRPVRPGDELAVERHDSERAVTLAGQLVMRASVDMIKATLPTALDIEEVEVALARDLPWPKPFPGCAGCGDRPDGLGSQIRPLGTRMVGGWTPSPDLASTDTAADASPSVSAEAVWTVVDCFTSWALFAQPPDDVGDTYVTGNIALDIQQPLRVGQRYYLDSWVDHDVAPGIFKLGSVVVGGAIRDSDGRIVALADQELVRTKGFGMDPHNVTASTDG